jgi:hypothetical protein
MWSSILIVALFGRDVVSTLTVSVNALLICTLYYDRFALYFHMTHVSSISEKVNWRSEEAG